MGCPAAGAERNTFTKARGHTGPRSKPFSRVLRAHYAQAITCCRATPSRLGNGCGSLDFLPEMGGFPRTGAAARVGTIPAFHSCCATSSWPDRTHDKVIVSTSIHTEISEPLRVTQVVFGLDRGGLEEVVGTLVKRLAGGGVAMSVITLSGRRGWMGEEIGEHVEQVHVLSPVPKLSLALPLGLLRCIKRTKPDVVHLHSGAWYKGAVAARLAGVQRVVYTEHGLLQADPAVGRLLRRRAAMLTDVVVPVSERLAQHLSEAEGIDGDRLYVIVNGVDTDRFTPGTHPIELRRGLAIPSDSFVIGSMGRLESVKAYHDLIRAYARIRTFTAPARPIYLVICGEGRERQSLERLSSELGVADTVRFPGWVDDSVQYYRLFDAFVLTSVSEGSPMSLLEAMSCGIAPVVTAVGANAATLGPELVGQLVPPGDVEAIASTIRDTLLVWERRVRVARLGRKRAEEHFSLERMAQEYMQVYQPRRATSERDYGGLQPRAGNMEND